MGRRLWRHMADKGIARKRQNGPAGIKLPEVQPHLLPVDFDGTPDARRLTGQTRKRATQLLSNGQVVAIFPGGGIATANHPMRGRAVDSIWHPFVGRLATLPGVTTLPVHFPGQNSRMFQIVSPVSYALRLAMIFHETRRLEGGVLPITVGAPLSAASLQTLNRSDVAATLRRITMAIAGDGHRALDESFIWPRHFRF
jgi:putative hemolysin